MKWVLLLLVLVAGVAVAEEEETEEVVAESEHKEEGKLITPEVFGLALAKTSLLRMIWSGFSVAAEVVILIALVFLIVTVNGAKYLLRNEDSESETSSESYEYYPPSSYGVGGYGTSGSSSYASGYSKRSLNFPSILNLPMVQRLTERVHRAIEEYSAKQD